MQAIEWCHFRWPRVTPNPGFKDTVVLKGECLQSDAFYRHSYYIGRWNRIGKLSIGKLAIQLTTPLLLHKPCKRFASVARVCQRQVAFLVSAGRSAGTLFTPHCSRLPALPCARIHWTGKLAAKQSRSKSCGLYSVWGRCNRWCIVTKFQHLTSWNVC